MEWNETVLTRRKAWLNELRPLCYPFIKCSHTRSAVTAWLEVSCILHFSAVSVVVRNGFEMEQRLWSKLPWNETSTNYRIAISWLHEGSSILIKGLIGFCIGTHRFWTGTHDFSWDESQDSLSANCNKITCSLMMLIKWTNTLNLCCFVAACKIIYVNFIMLNPSHMQLAQRQARLDSF